MSETDKCPKCGSKEESWSYDCERWWTCGSRRLEDGQFIQTQRCELLSVRRKLTEVQAENARLKTVNTSQELADRLAEEWASDPPTVGETHGWFRTRVAGWGLKEVERLKAENAELREANAELRSAVRLNLDAALRAIERITELEAENAQLRKDNADLSARLGEAVERAEKAEADLAAGDDLDRLDATLCREHSVCISKGTATISCLDEIVRRRRELAALTSQLDAACERFGYKRCKQSDGALLATIQDDLAGAEEGLRIAKAELASIRQAAEAEGVPEWKAWRALPTDTDHYYTFNLDKVKRLHATATHLAAEVQCLKQRLDSVTCPVPSLADYGRLKAIVERLPVTADGVPIVPPMTIYDRNGDSFDVDWVSVGTGHRSPDCYTEEWMDHENLPDNLHRTAHDKANGQFRWWNCYSTREAAEAAGNESNHDQ